MTLARTLPLIVVLVVPGVGCHEDSVEALGQVGEACTPCECSFGQSGPCDCHECLNMAYDPEAKAIVVCSGTWTIEKECPGGGHVICNPSVTYEFECLDADGDPIPLQ